MKEILIIILLFVFDQSLYAQNLYRSACQGNLERLDSLLQNTSIDSSDHRGRTLLHWAVACEQKEVFDYLVEEGININGEDHQKKTPMHMAVRFDNEEFLDLLINTQINDDWKKSYGASLLELSVLKRNKNLLKKIIESGIDINSSNERGSTALEISQRIEAKHISAFLLEMGADQSKVRNIEAKGNFMGQIEPNIVPKIFAPNFISTEEYEFGSVFNSKGTEFYYGVDVNGKSEIRYTHLMNDVWSKPEVILSHEEYGYNDPFLSPDEERLYFISRMPSNGIGPSKNDHDIWYVEKRINDWSVPINAGPNINTEGNEYYISFTNKGTMYFSSDMNAPEERKRSDLDIYYSEYIGEKFQKPVALSKSINTENYEADVFVDPEEKYLIFCTMRSEGLGRGDLYISYKNPDGTWTNSMNLGQTINTKNHELCPYVTPDGKYLFYTSNEDIYWVSTEVIRQLKENRK